MYCWKMSKSDTATIIKQCLTEGQWDGKSQKFIDFISGLILLFFRRYTFCCVFAFNSFVLPFLRYCYIYLRINVSSVLRNNFYFYFLNVFSRLWPRIKSSFLRKRFQFTKCSKNLKSIFLWKKLAVSEIPTNPWVVNHIIRWLDEIF